MQKLPSFLQPYLASYDLSKLDINRDKTTIITEVLNKGGYKALKWLTNTYTKNEIETIAQNPTRGSWYKEILQYWLNMFNVSLPKEMFQKAVINL